MIDTTVLLSFCYAPAVRANLMWWEAFYRLLTVFGSTAFGLEAFGSVASDLAASGLAASFLTTGFLVLMCRHRGWFHGFAAAGCVRHEDVLWWVQQQQMMQQSTNSKN